MRLLICTQKVDSNDDVLGFFHRWIIEFARHYERVLVLCLEKGTCNLPSNVEVYSLGKEQGVSDLEKLSRFYRFVWGRHDDYDRVFVHMNSEYLILGGLLWRLLGVRIGLWYTHRAVHWKLRIAEKLSHVVFSAAGASFRLKSRKLHILGHGIALEEFVCPEKKTFHKPLRIVIVGRITPIKGVMTVIEAARILKERGVSFAVTFVGKPATESDRSYEKQAKELVVTYKLSEVISFAGSIPNREIIGYYCKSDIALNMVPTGGIDKTVIEAMASQTLPITSNQAFDKYFGTYAEALLSQHGDPNDLADTIEALVERDDLEELRDYLVEVASKGFGVEKLIDNIKKLL